MSELPTSSRGQVFVLGSLNMDIVATASHHPQVGETVLGETLNYYPGGKGLNQAVAAARDDFQSPFPTAAMLGAVGNDSFGQQLLQLAGNENIETYHLLTRRETPSGVALITVAESDNTIVVIPGANGTLTPQDFRELAFSVNDVLLAQFEIPKTTIVALFAQANAAGTTTILNPAPASEIPPDLLGCIDFLVVNDTELELLTASNPSPGPAQARSVLGESMKAVIHTRGSQGLVVATHDSQFELPAHDVTVVDTTAAGDCFCGVLAASLLRRESLETAVARANAAAALCVQSSGATPSIPTGHETSNFLANFG